MWDLIVSVPDHCLSFYFTDLLDVFLDYFGTVRLNRKHLNALIKDAIIYNHPTVLDNLLNFLRPVPCDICDYMHILYGSEICFESAISKISVFSILCDILKRSDCKNVLHKHSLVLRKSLENSPQKPVLFELANPNLSYYLEFKDEIKSCLKKIPYVQKQIRHFQSNVIHWDDDVLEMFLEFNLFTDKNRICKSLLEGYFKGAVLSSFLNFGYNSS